MVDLSSFLTAIVAGIFSVLGPVALYLIQTHLKDRAAAATLAAAVQNSLGAMQQVASGVITATHLKVPMPGVSPQFVSGVQYVLDHAGSEAAHFGITPVEIADKINAQIGLVNIAANHAPPIVHPTLPVPAATAAGKREFLNL